MSSAPAPDDLAAPGEHVDVWSVLPPGNGYPDGITAANRDDQRLMYQNLDGAATSGTIPEDDLGRFYKQSNLELAPGSEVATQRPRAGVAIRWDRWGVPYVEGQGAADVAFGVGFALMEGRALVAEIARTVGRRGGLELGAPDLFAAIAPSKRIDYTDAELEAGLVTLRAEAPAEATAILDELDAYVAGINAWIAAHPEHRLLTAALGLPTTSWRRADVVASLLTVVTGPASGGEELANAASLRAMVDTFGPGAAPDLYHDLRAADAPSTTHVDQPFHYPRMAGGSDPDDVDPASVAAPDVPIGPAAFEPKPGNSNFVAVSGDRTRSGHPLLVGGPQNGLTSPALLFEMVLDGGGFHSRGVVIPGGGPYVFVGRNEHAAWTSTSGETDQTDVRAERLCNPDGSPPTAASTAYVFQGACVPFARPSPTGVPRSIHGPEIGRGAVGGLPVAFTRQRASAGREILAALAIRPLNRGEEDGAEGFLRLTDRVDFSGNWVYVDDTDIAYSLVGRHPVRADGASTELPTWGTGEWEWSGFVDPAEQPSVINPTSGCLVSWNNRIAPGFRTADDDWGNVGPHRVDLLAASACDRSDLTLGELVRSHTLAGLADLRGAEVLPAVLDVLDGSTAPTPRLEAVRRMMAAWSAGGALRLDLDDDLLFDDPSVGIMDEWFPRLVGAVLGADLAGFARNVPLRVDAGASTTRSSFGAGWYGFVTRDLRRLAGGPDLDARRPVACGGGDVDACRAAIWASLAAATFAVGAAQLFDVADRPEAWRVWTFPQDRYLFLPVVFNPTTMRWSNRPAYELAVEFR